MDDYQNGYNRGRGGSEKPIGGDDTGRKMEGWAEGYAQRRRDERTDYILTHPDDPFCTKKDQF